ncbi:MAG: SDR family oxidoreductase [Actinomycetota bacterium]|nr:SDR family oxidoreductase [Actinomycetota bacterium]
MSFRFRLRYSRPCSSRRAGLVLVVGTVAGVHTDGEVLVGGDPSQQRVQLCAFGVVERGEHRILVRVSYPTYLVEQGVPGVGEVDRVEPPVSGVVAALDHPALFQPVDQADQPGRRGARCWASSCWLRPGPAATTPQMLTRQVALQVAQHNVRVNAIAPGAVLTDRLTQMPAQVRDSVAAQHPLGRLGDPADIAAAA